VKVAIVGVGGLGSALARGLVGHELVLCDRHPEKLAPFSSARIAAGPAEAAAGTDVVVLCVKPKFTAAVASQLHAAPSTLVVSCAAGVPVSALAGTAARAMPSIGAAKSASTTGVFLGPSCDAARDRPRLLSVFGALGPVREVMDEEKLHAVAAVTASGPAWMLLAVEALVDAGVESGLTRDDALAFARGALVAAAARLDEGVEPTSLRAHVTSPGGTTAAGLAALERGAVRAAFADAVRAAVARSQALASIAEGAASLVGRTDALARRPDTKLARPKGHE
jgi:pyrroline-5-carboxylate reductase